jgi:acyl-coenzyme A synthetase/AMP-(fatty) acid ligase
VVRFYSRFTKRFDRVVGFRYSVGFGPRIRVTRDGKRVRAGQAGRLEVRGSTVTGGYWNNHELALDSMSNGWFFTGDIVRITRLGFVTQLDREVDVVQTRTGPVYTLEVEEVIHKHPNVMDAVVYGERQPDGTQRPACLIATRETQSAGSLLAELNRALPERWAIASLELSSWSDFPIGLTGKSLKRELRDATEPLSVPEANRPVVVRSA